MTRDYVCAVFICRSLREQRLRDSHSVEINTAKFVHRIYFFGTGLQPRVRFPDQLAAFVVVFERERNVEQRLGSRFRAQFVFPRAHEYLAQARRLENLISRAIDQTLHLRHFDVFITAL